VVADEVRNLAAHTQRSTGEIRTIIDGLRTETANLGRDMATAEASIARGVEVIHATDLMFAEIIKAVKAIEEARDRIGHATNLQAERSAAVYGNAHAVKEGLTSSSVAVHQVHSTLQGQNDRIVRLREETQRFTA
jgi:methyl-accepting chemotaxis protein